MHKLKGNILVALTLVLIWSCNSKHKNGETSTTPPNKGVITEGKNLPGDIVPDAYLPIPGFEDYKKYCETSSVLLNSKWAKYKKPSDEGIIGYYTLFNGDRKRNNKFEYIGELAVFVPNGKNWSFDDPNQTFLGIRLQRPGIRLMNSIEVGSSIQHLKSELGKPKLENDHLIVYYGPNGTLGVFETNGGKITQIYYGSLDLKGKEILTVGDIINLIKAW